MVMAVLAICVSIFWTGFILAKFYYNPKNDNQTSVGNNKSLLKQLLGREVFDPKDIFLYTSEEVCNFLPVLLSFLSKSSLLFFRSTCTSLQNLLKRAETDSLLGLSLLFCWESKSDCGLFQSVLLSEQKSGPEKNQPISANQFVDLRNRYLPTLKFFDDLMKVQVAVGQVVQLEGRDEPVFHPTQVNKRITKVEVEKIFQSQAKPLLLALHDHNSVISRIILKKGDDMRYDVAVLNIFKIMNFIWKEEKLFFNGTQVEASIYKCISMNSDIGMCELINDVIPLRNFSKEIISNQSMRDKLIATAVGGFIAAYILKIKDRHNDNILISRADGSVFHIDFGFLFGKGPRLDTGPFAVTNEIKLAMGDDWDKFIDTSCKAFHIIQKHHLLIIKSCLDCFEFAGNLDDLKELLQKSLFVDPLDTNKTKMGEANTIIKSLLQKAPQNMMTQAKNYVHGTKMRFSEKSLS
eukprot:c17529_g2_i1.p1 GENE.c17529_g2_i1~~c17529_g2_i1.p1  ORF type:complete len:464 (-),score=164.80 c17529_g2_i1:11-1402(-)